MVAGAGLFRRRGTEARLDPVRWRPPGRGTLLRSATVAVLVAVAGALAWSGPAPCGPGSVASGSPGSGPDAAQPGGSDPAGSRPPDPATVGSGPSGPALTGSGPSDPAVAGSLGQAAPPPPGTSPHRPAVPAGTVGVPLRLTDPAPLALIEPGSRVDVLRVDDSGRTTKLAGAALVLGVTDADDFVTAGMLVALSPAEAERAVAHQGRGFAVLLRPG